LGRIDGMSFTFTRSSRCLLIFFVAVQDGPDRHAVDRDSCNPLVNEANAPANMTFLAIRSIRISWTDFSTMLRSSNMHALGQISRIGERTLKVNKAVGEVSNAQCGSN
jgi:hypothetical protein